MNKIILTFFLMTATATLLAQTLDEQTIRNPKHDIGIGDGIDYGGLGIRYTYMVLPKWGAFGAVGYMLAGTGYNFGIVYKAPITEGVTAFGSAMYGSNAALVSREGGRTNRKIYYGASLAFGIELKGKKHRNNFWNFEVVIPVTDAVESNDDLYFRNSVGLSLGYHIVF